MLVMLLYPMEPDFLPGLWFPAPLKIDVERCFGSSSARVRAKPDCGEHQGKGHKSIFLMSPSKPSWRGKG